MEEKITRCKKCKEATLHVVVLGKEICVKCLMKKQVQQKLNRTCL